MSAFTLAHVIGGVMDHLTEGILSSILITLWFIYKVLWDIHGMMIAEWNAKSEEEQAK